MKKVLKFMPSIVFLIFIYGMAILFFVLPKDEYSSSEKRYLKQFPEFNSDTFFSGDFGEEFETYLSDHTPYRTFWVGLNSYYNLALGNPLSNGIYHCDNGYLVNDPPEYDRLYTNIDVIAQFAQKTDVPVTMLLAPSTGYIVSDVLPNKEIVYHDDERFEDINKTLIDSGVTFVDIRKEFKDAYASGTQVYYKTDHHWTTHGAYLAYCELADSLDFTALTKDNYNISAYSDFYGTAYSSSGFWMTEPDSIEVWESKNIAQDSVTVEITEGSNTDSFDSMFFEERLKEDDKYPVFLDGNHSYTTITNKALKEQGNDKKLLILKDSFAHALTPFLADHYSEIVMVDMRYYKQSITQLMNNKDFDHVLFLYSIDNLGTDTDLAWISMD